MAHVETHVDGHVLVIRLTRPEKYNALSFEMYHLLGQALQRLEDDAELRVAALIAEGRNFTAGVELDQWAPVFGSGQAIPVNEGEIDPFGLTGPQHSKPVVIGVQGYCFTWGVELLLNTEMRVAGADTQFQMLEVQRGLYPCCGATLRLPQEIGWGNAHRYLLTGERWNAEDAFRWGLVQEVVPAEQVHEATLDLARRVAAAAPLGVRGCLASARYARTAEREPAVAHMMKHLAPVMQSEDAAEGVQSFLERRDAVFKGR
ncbi:MAG: crotonase/enoyl-CoA hydratase family protein [Pseudomonadota bacterium]